MSYPLQLSSVPTPDLDLEVFPFMNKLRQEAGTQPPSALLQRFHDALLALFPDAPWSDGHYAGAAGRLTLVQRSAEVMPHVLQLAADLGLTLVDNISGAVHRPPTFQVVLEGPADGVASSEAATRLAALMRKPEAEMAALLASGRRTVVKKGVSRFQARQYAAALRDRAGCHATLAAEPGPAARAMPKASPVEQPAAPSAAAPAAALSLAPAEPSSASPYRPPSAELESGLEGEALEGNDELYQVAEGIRMTCSTIALSFLQGALFKQGGSLPYLICAIALSIYSLHGTWRLMTGLGFGAAVRYTLLGSNLLALGLLYTSMRSPNLLAIGAIVLLGLACFVFWLVLVVKGVRRLKRAGLGLGLFGASKADVRRLGGLDEEARLPSTFLAWLCFGVTVLCFAGSLTQTAPAQAAGKALPCELVGMWEYSKDGRQYAVYLDDAGVLAGGKAGSDDEEGPEFVGTWHVEGNAMHWNELLPLPGRNEVRQVTALGEGSFSVRDANGQSTTFELTQREPSQRCGFAASP